MVGYLLLFILALHLSIGVHEFGHYITARFFGINVDSLNIGFGPSLISYRNSKNTNFYLRLLPLGGFVSYKDERELERLSLGKQIINLAAGVVFNFILCIISISLYFRVHLFKAIYRFFAISKASIVEISKNFRISDYYSAENSIENVFTQSAQGVQQFGFLPALIALGIILILFNLLPIPPLDGGQIIIKIIKRILLRLGVSEKIINRAVKPIYIIGGLFLLSPLIINQLLTYNETVVSTEFKLFVCIILGVAVLIRFTKKSKNRKIT